MINLFNTTKQGAGKSLKNIIHEILQDHIKFQEWDFVAVEKIKINPKDFCEPGRIFAWIIEHPKLA
jgi:hypothetical protein